MSYTIIRPLLEQRLAALTPVLPTAWENTAYQAVLGAPYQRVDLLPADTENPTLGDGFRREAGLLQVTLFYPINTGAGAAQTRAELIRTQFARGLTLTQDNVRVQIPRTPSIGRARPSEGWLMLPVRITYSADVHG